MTEIPKASGDPEAFADINTFSGIVLIVELSIRVSLMSGTESNLDEFLTQEVKERRLAEGAIILDCLIHHVPSMHLPLVMPHYSLDVLYHSLAQHLF